jgi:putative phage-type endonuclease
VSEEPVAVEGAEEVERSSGIGSSEIAAVLGLNPYMSAFDVWLTKTNRAPADVDTAPKYWGRRLQRVIVEEYEIRRKVNVVFMFDEPMRHPERSWQIASPDAIIPTEKVIVEAKAPGLRQAPKYGPEGTDEIPEEHLLQCHWQLSTLDYQEAAPAILLGGQDFRIYRVTRDRELEDAMLSAGYKFWFENVQADVPPEIKDTDRTRDWLRRAFPRELQPLRRATEEEALLAHKYADALRQKAVIEEYIGILDVKIRAAIAADGGLEADDFRLTYRKAKDSQKTDWKAAGEEMRLALRLIAEATERTDLKEDGLNLELIRQTAESGLAAIPAHTAMTPGSRRLLKAGTIFDDLKEK